VSTALHMLPVSVMYYLLKLIRISQTKVSHLSHLSVPSTPNDNLSYIYTKNKFCAEGYTPKILVKW